LSGGGTVGGRAGVGASFGIDDVAGDSVRGRPGAGGRDSGEAVDVGVVEADAVDEVAPDFAITTSNNTTVNETKRRRDRLVTQRKFEAYKQQKNWKGNEKVQTRCRRCWWMRMAL
jgi:hypothetical protein